MPRLRRRKQPSQAVVVPSAARTTNGNSSTITGWARNGLTVKLDVTAAGGTPSLTVTVQDSPDGSVWTTRDTFGVKTGVTTETRVIAGGLDAFQRVAWTITGGTPSVTFSVQFASSTATLQ